MQCFFGQMLMDSSEQLVEGIYDCGWEKLSDLKVKKSLILMMMKAQKMTKLKVLNMVEISLEEFGIVGWTFRFNFFD